MATVLAPLASVEFEPVLDTAEEFRGRPGEVRFMELPPRRAVMVDGEGAPGPATFQPRMPGLYATAYGLRFALKRRGVETKVRPLEGLWWTASGSTTLDPILGGDRDDWRWTLLIVLPDDATEDDVQSAVEGGRGRMDPSVAPLLRVERFEEGRVAQVLHLGPYAEERPTIERLHAAVAEAGLRLRGKHHEIYLGDPSRSRPDRLRTLIRHPVEQR